ncbi:hypothetical protein [Roseisolibacter sp. H3M3-2]|uniref:hypothetical protein n=1 Tax=Roseisolibacter sp. H3M3-2 TaxID=3031323 RepID=UPI0023DA8C03|nr:hypothetical protein [Roseisolibacter sp. H3M3-2]MDF1503658.1 hypothetical protein [Roseisolibacter sp. H3M3-2]
MAADHEGGPPQLPVALTFAGVAGAPASGGAPTVLPAELGETLRAFFDAHPTVAWVQFEIALSEDGESLEFAGGTLHRLGGQPLREGRDAERAAADFRRLLRADARLAELPVVLTVATGGIDHAFRIAREATGAAPGVPSAGAPDEDERAMRRERARLAERDARYDQRDFIPDDDGQPGA